MSDYLMEIEETESFLSKATSPGLKNALQQHLDKIKLKEIDKQKIQLSNNTPIAVDDNKPPVVSMPKPIAVGSFIPIESYAWDQGQYNSPCVSVFIDLDEVGTVKDKVEVSFTKTSFDVKVNGLNGKNYRLWKDNLEKDIIPEQSSYVVKKNKITVKLQKVKGEYSYDHWTSLTAKKKREAEADTKKDPMGGIMDMMKNMYEDGDDNMKRIIGEAMMKSQRGEKPTAPSFDSDI